MGGSEIAADSYDSEEESVRKWGSISKEYSLEMQAP